MREYPGGFELMVLLAVLRAGDAAYGVSIGREIEAQSRRSVSLGSVYAALERLEAKELVSSAIGDSTPERGGRAKRYFRVTPRGLRVVKETQRTLVALWTKVPVLKGGAA
jgi:PadR family transcriptional regulator PadR